MKSKIDHDSMILSDTIAYLGENSNRSKEPVRVITFQDYEGKQVHLATNLFLLKADVITDLYRSRWQIELFFQWIKQHLNVKRLFGTTPNAVYGQLFAALITYVLVNWLYQRTCFQEQQFCSLIQFVRKIHLAQLPKIWLVRIKELLESIKLGVYFSLSDVSERYLSERESAPLLITRI